MASSDDRTTDTTLILNLFSVTEKKLNDLVTENYCAKKDLFSLAAEQEAAREKVRIVNKENECLRKLLSAYESSFKAWKKLEEENKALKLALPIKEKESEEKVERLRGELLRAKEIADKETSKQLREAKDEVMRLQNENKKLKALVEDEQHQHAKVVAEMNLEFEKKLLKVESDFASGVKRASVSSMSVSCGVADDASRIYSSFQKKLENVKNEYEEKLRAMRLELDTFKSKSAPCSSSDSNNVLIKTREDSCPKPHASSTNSIQAAKVSTVSAVSSAAPKRSCLSDSETSSSRLANNRIISLMPIDAPPAVRAFGHHVQVGPPAKKSFQPTSSLKQADNSNKQQSGTNTTQPPQTQKRVSFADDSSIDIYEFID